MFVVKWMNVIKKKRYFFLDDISLLWPIVRAAFYESVLPITIPPAFSLHLFFNTYLLTTNNPLSNPCINYIGLAYQGKDIVFRFIIKCSSLRVFGQENWNMTFLKLFLWSFIKDIKRMFLVNFIAISNSMFIG
jgi:hypothetical protein